jgi:hypothetical protein
MCIFRAAAGTLGPIIARDAGVALQIANEAGNLDLEAGLLESFFDGVRLRGKAGTDSSLRKRVLITAEPVGGGDDPDASVRLADDDAGRGFLAERRLERRLGLEERSIFPADIAPIRRRLLSP